MYKNKDYSAAFVSVTTLTNILPLDFSLNLITPGVVATIIFALPPVIRLTNLGIRQVGKGFKEAGSSLGLTRLLILIKIEIPLALKTIMAGIN